MALEIPIEDYASQIGRGNYERLEILKAKQFPKLQSTNTTLQGMEDQGTNILMAVYLYEAVKNDDVGRFISTSEIVLTEREPHLATILHQVSASGNSVLHKAASFGSREIAKLIIDHFPFLVNRTNNLGDTALHVATKARKLNVVKVLVDKSCKLSPANDNDTLSQMKNHTGNTALHEAVKALFTEALSCMFVANPKVSNYLNEKGESPLCLAIETENIEILELLLEAPSVYDGLIERPQEESPVYAAILEEKKDILEEIFMKYPKLFLIRDKKRKTPLHFAASKGYIDGVRFLLSKFGEQAFKRSKNWDFPIHIASKKGHIKIVEKLLEQQWPNPTELLNKEGQNILHVAAENGKNNVVKGLLKHSKVEELKNAVDKNGNTALHLASMNLHSKVICSLTWDKRVDLKRRNKEGLTALDIVLGIQTYSRTRKITTIWALRSAGTPWSEKGVKASLLRAKQTPNLERIKGPVDLMSVIAVLVATVTFAAGLTVPGGFNSSDNGGLTMSGGFNSSNKVPAIPGLATLGKKRAFQVFIVCDSIAMYFSMTGAILLLGPLVARDIAFSATANAVLLVGVAIFQMSLAFMSATYLIVSNISWLAVLVLVMGILYLSCLAVLCIVLFFPFGIRHPIFHCLCQVVIPLILHYTAPFNYKVDDQKQKSFPVEKDKHEESQPSNKDRQEEFQQKKD
ncbi:protein ACCELERATED CELL DEATH 6-like [Castanea sativa]|uniref:protein ACCELERATED CELL DEATH 6-like n=1 Tax=Castanea sativa TaxID=21020 RepID=UPI003F64C562